MKTKLLISSVAGCLLAVTTVQSQIISVDQLNGSGQAITGTFGIASLGTVVGGWNNLVKPYGATNLLYSDASSSTVGFTLSGPGGYSAYNAAYTNTPLQGGISDYTTTTGTTSLTLNNLNANFANGYWIIAYVGGFNSCLGATISDGTDTFYYQPLSSPTAPVTFVQTTQTTDLGSGLETVAQYAVFGSSSAPLTSDSLTLTLNDLYGGGAGLGGFQIIGAAAPVPEPAPISIALLGGLGFLLCARRK